MSRLFQILFLIWVISVLLCALLYHMPGDPLDLIQFEAPHLKTDHLADFYQTQLDFWQVYAHWMSDMLGTSRLYGHHVLPILTLHLFTTFKLILTGFGSAFLIAFSLCILDAYRPLKLLNSLSLLAISAPSFWIGTLLILTFSYHLKLFAPHSFILASLTFAFSQIGSLIQIFRSSLAMADLPLYSSAVRARGASKGRLVLKHQLGASLIPLLSYISLHLGSLFSGALVIEMLFRIKGVGRLIYEASLNHDYNLALLALMVISLICLLGQWGMDALQRRLAPI